MKHKKQNKYLTLWVSRLSQLLVAVGGMATIYTCTSLLHEKKVPNELLENNRFTHEE